MTKRIIKARKKFLKEKPIKKMLIHWVIENYPDNEDVINLHNFARSSKRMIKGVSAEIGLFNCFIADNDIIDLWKKRMEEEYA